MDVLCTLNDQDVVRHIYSFLATPSADLIKNVKYEPRDPALSRAYYEMQWDRARHASMTRARQRAYHARLDARIYFTGLDASIYRMRP